MGAAFRVPASTDHPEEYIEEVKRRFYALKGWVATKYSFTPSEQKYFNREQKVVLKQISICARIVNPRSKSQEILAQLSRELYQLEMRVQTRVVGNTTSEGGSRNLSEPLLQTIPETD